MGKKTREAQRILYLRMVPKIFSAFILMPVPAYYQYQTCPKCESQVPQGSNYCNICGTPLNQPIILRICPSCKTKIPTKSHFCSECGYKQ